MPFRLHTFIQSTVNLIIQEVFAKLIMYNFASLLHAYASAAKEALTDAQKQSTGIKYPLTMWYPSRVN